MKCEHCGHEATETPKQDPWCMYQVNGAGVVIDQDFDPDNIPDGWYDSPGAAKLAIAETAKEPSKVDMRSKEGRALKAAQDDNSTGINQ